MELSGLHCYIDALAQRQPDAPAAVDVEGRWSYGQLRRAAGRVAALLARHGVKAEKSQDPSETPRPVALALPRGNVWYACCYACWRLGVPVVASDDMPDKAAEAERLARLWRELRPQALIGDGAPPSGAVVVFTKEQILQVINGENGHSDAVSDGPCSPDSVLLYTYTGGTTKHSKCVVVTHAMALWEMKNYHIVLDGKMSSRDRVLQFTSAYWGAAAFGQIDIALAFGACVVFSQSRTEGLAAVIEEYQITVLGTVPSLLRATYPGGPMTKAPSLRLVLTWGEALPVKLSKAWKEVCFMVDLLIASEYWLALYSHCDVFTDPLDGREKHLMMPLPKLQIHLLSADGDLGDEGEMILRGDTVSPGYIGVDGRICNDEGSDFFLKGLRYLRTRDKLRRVEGGCLVYCGRSGSLAKRGGQFVDLEDLAEQLQGIPGMASCALLQGERLEAFVTLEPEEVLSRLPHPVTSVLNDAQKLLGPSARLHLRSRLPRHPVTGKVQRNQLEEQVSASVQRELQHLQLRTRIQGQMLRSYCSWYPAVLLQMTFATLLGHLAGAGATAWDVLWTWPLRLLLLPYLWAALAYTPLLPLPTKRRKRAFYEELSISPPEMLILVTGLVPWNWICTLQVLACALLVFYRREAQRALPFLGFALVTPWAPFLAQLALCAGCVLLDVSLPHDDRSVLPSLPLCFYLVMPKWFSDEVRWYLKHNRLRKLLYFWLLPKPKWDSSWLWEDHDRSFTILNGCGPVRVAKANQGLSLTVEFSEVPVLSPSGPTVRPSPLEQESPLAGLVRRAGGDPSLGQGLRLDSLQGTVLAELIRKELRRSISVADVLRSRDLPELQEKLSGANCVEMEMQKEDSAVSTSSSSTYRLWMLQFPRHPVDWCLRYETGRHVDVAAMQRAVNRLVARHSALRTSETPDEPLREIMDKAAAMWQLWRSCCGSSRYWRYVRRPMASALFALWPRTIVHTSKHIEVKVPELEDGRVRRERWDWASHDQYIGGMLDDLLRPRRWPFEVAVAPLFYGQATGRDAIEAALAKPPSEVAWYIYCSITHAYSDGLCGQALFADLLRFYEEELHGTVTPPEPAPEPLALLQRRLWRSFDRDAAEQPEPNEDLYHESICDDWGKRRGMSRRIYFHENVTRTLRLAASNVFGCSTDLAWLTAIMCALFRLFPEKQRMMLILKASCRDGPGEGQMVAFLSEARVFALDTGDPTSATILEVHQQIQRVRLSRDWRAPEPFEFGLCVYVNIVSAMVNSLPSGYRHVVRETSPPSYWDSVAYSHLNLRIDQLRMDEWDFRIFHHDSAWGWDWPTSFAYQLGEVIRRMATDPLSPLMEVEELRTIPGATGTGPGQRTACEDSPAAPRQKRSKEAAASGENGPPAKSLRLSKDFGHGP